MPKHVSLSKSEEYKNHSIKQLICSPVPYHYTSKKTETWFQSFTARVICQYDVFSSFYHKDMRTY